MDIYYALMGFFVKGGIFMAPIALVGALALAIAAERYITLTRLVVTNRRVWQDVEPALNNADFEVAREKTSKGDTIGASGVAAASRAEAGFLPGASSP